MSDKAELLRTYLGDRGVQLSGTGRRQVSCFNKDAHPRGDRNPSASVDLSKGRYKCFACGLEGDVYDLYMQETGATFAQARATLGTMNPRAEEPTWI
jgi:hypothetical protein